MRHAKDVDDYIAHASVVTQPILVALRRIIQRASPLLEESIKWGIPCYVYKGPIVGIAAYQKHVTWGFWKAALLNDPHGLIGRDGILKGGKITHVSEVPAAAKMISLIEQAIALNETGVKPITPEPKLPPDLAAALKQEREAAKQYAAFTPARKWQYVNWVEKAKRLETRAKRVQAAIVRISEGKPMK